MHYVATFGVVLALQLEVVGLAPMMRFKLCVYEGDTYVITKIVKRNVGDKKKFFFKFFVANAFICPFNTFVY
jgi:hypothetical protein